MSNTKTKSSRKRRRSDGPRLAERLWHYTNRTALENILETRSIIPATVFAELSERPAAWFTRRSNWEGTANKGAINSYGERLTPTKESTVAVYGGLARIEIRPEAAPHGWASYKKCGGVSPEAVKYLAEFGKMVGSNPYDWWVSFQSVQENDWLAVEVWNGWEWVPHRDWSPAAAVNTDAPVAVNADAPVAVAVNADAPVAVNAGAPAAVAVTATCRKVVPYIRECRPTKTKATKTVAPQAETDTKNTDANKVDSDSDKTKAVKPEATVQLPRPTARSVDKVPTTPDAPESVAEAAELVAIVLLEEGAAYASVESFLHHVRGLAAIEPMLSRVEPAHLRERLSRSTSKTYQRETCRSFTTFFWKLAQLGWWTGADPTRRLDPSKIPTARRRTRLCCPSAA